MRKTYKTPQNPLEKRKAKQVLVLDALMCLVRVGGIASTYILLVAFFDLSPISSAAVTMCLQVFGVFTHRISEYLYPRMTARNIQILGLGVAVISSAGMILSKNFYIFCGFALCASFVKVAREITEPVLNHKFIENDDSHSARESAYNMSGSLLSAAVIATMSYFEINYGPMIFILSVAILTYALIITRVIDVYDDDDEFRALQKLKKESENTREDYAKNNSYKIRTLCFFDLNRNIAEGIVACLSPVIFMKVSHVFQGTSSIISFICGVSAFFVGYKLIPVLDRAFNPSEKMRWMILLGSAVFAMISELCASTYWGVNFAYVSSAVCGVSFTFAYSNMQLLAAKELDKTNYAIFNCKINQRSAIVFIIVPLILGGLSKIVSLNTLMALSCGLIFAVLAISAVRVSIINRAYANETSTSEGSIAFAARKVFNGIDRRATASLAYHRSSPTIRLRRYHSTRKTRPSLNRVRDYHFEFRRVVASSQTYADMVAAWRTHRYRRNTSQCSSA